jgi:threonylcarbamoyladenosine tRNA methylthiotransferase MtaB
MNPKTIAFHHFGCKVNFAEASTLSRQFKEKGYTIVDHKEKADIYVISTCTVTTVAEKKCRAAIRQAHHQNPDARIAVIGCYAELKSTEIANIEGVSIVLGHTGKFNLVEEIETQGHPGQDYHGHFSENTFVPSFSYGDRTRSFLKVQDGCDYYCSYCTIPFARGHSRSDTVAHVLDSAREVIRNGVKEIVLTGVNIGDFGRGNDETLFDLLVELEKLENAPRIRISSIEPDLLTDEIIELFARSRHLMPHFHIPLQSGCDRILKLMKRKYTTELYAARIRKIRSLLPDACIAADIITGFPGETEEDHAATMKFVEGLDISYLHVFSYSRRDNTLASKMGGDVPDTIRKTRSQELHHLSEKKKIEFYLRNKGKNMTVLFESDNDEGWMHGFTENYIKVKRTFDPALVNALEEVRLEEMEGEAFKVVR